MTDSAYTIQQSTVEGLGSALDGKAAVDLSNLSQTSSTGILDVLGYKIGGSNPRFLRYTGNRKLKILKNTNIKLGEYGWWMTSTDVELNCDTLIGGSLAANTEYYLYLCHNGTDFDFILSTNSTYPSGYTADNSIKIGWFHTIGVSIPSYTYTYGGNTLTHPYSGMSAGDIDPNGVWCKTFRPQTNLPFFNYVEPLKKAVSVFLQSGTGTSTQFIANATITDTRIYALHQEDIASVNCYFPTQYEFAVFAQGSNELTTIAGAADPITTGFHKNTAGRYMISAYGLWSCCGELWQFINSDIANGGSGWNIQSGNKGNIYGSAPVLLSGGDWHDSSNCGSCSLDCDLSRLSAGVDFSVRAVSTVEADWSLAS